MSILRPGRNSWKSVRAHRFSVLVDSESYFSAFLSCLTRARREVTLLGWDIDSRVVLDPQSAGLRLGDALRIALERNPELRVRILCWDFALIYALERQLFPRFYRAFRHSRVQFALDGRHPFAGSHHQKVVVMDGEVAFIGGLDIATRRWDTREHRSHDPRRRDLTGKPYGPFHDVQAVCDGEAARALAELACERWFHATGERIEFPQPASTLWPAGVIPDFTDIDVAISRTNWNAGLDIGVREVERLFLDSIRAARSRVYVENQYFTSERLAAAIAARLSEPECPEFLVLLPQLNSGWKEEYSMGTLRNRLIRRLLDLDRGRGRIRFCCPVNAGVPINLHSKLMTVDEELLHLGSSNFSNRSLGLDTECDVAVEAAGSAETAAGIARVRDGLLAEHLGATPAGVAAHIARNGSLFAAVDHFSTGGRALVPFPLESESSAAESLRETLTPESTVLDPGHPIEEDSLFRHFVAPGVDVLARKYRRVAGRLVVGLAAAALLASPSVRDTLHLGESVAQLRTFAETWFPSWAVGIGAVAAGAALRLPTELLIFAACLTFGLGAGWAFSFLGLVLAALAFFLAGRAAAPIGRHRSAFWPYFLLNANLIAPLTAIAFRAGRLRSPARAFVLGTLAGQAVRSTVTAVYAAAFQNFVLDPGTLSAALLAVTT